MVRFFSRQNVLLGMLLAATALILILCAIRLPELAADDSFIHRRIALNYLHLGRAYYNPGERVMVTSSPVWTLLLTLTSAILPHANAASWLELIFAPIGAAAAYLLAGEEIYREELPEWRGLLFPGLAFIYVLVGVLSNAVEQMETPCAIALMLAGCLGVLRRRFWGMPLLVAACFTRYEAFPLCFLAGAWVSIKRRWTKASLLTSSGVGVFSLIWMVWQYGTIIPTAIIAKSHVYVMTYSQVIAALVLSKISAVLCLAIGLFWWVYGRSRSREQNPVAFLLVGFGMLLGATYILHRTLMFPWYVPLVLVPFSLGVLLWTDQRDFNRSIVGIVFAGALLLPFMVRDVKLLLACLGGSPSNTLDFLGAARVHQYQSIGAALDTACPSGILMTSEIGGLGSSFHGEILDGVGLASPEAIHYHPMRVPEERSNSWLGEIPSGFVRDRHPDLIVSYDILAESALPAALTLGYVDYSYPMFVREDRNKVSGSLWGAKRMHVLVAPGGRCSPVAVDQAVHVALDK